MSEKIDALGYAAIEHSPFGFAHQRMILTRTGEVEDIEFIHVNKVFARIIGKTSQELKGQKNSNIFKENTEFMDMMDNYRTGLIAGNQIEFEDYYKVLGKRLRVKLIPHEGLTFFCWVEDVTSEHVLMENASDIFQEIDISPAKSLERFCALTHASFGVFLTFFQEKKKTSPAVFSRLNAEDEPLKRKLFDIFNTVAFNRELLKNAENTISLDFLRQAITQESLKKELKEALKPYHHYIFQAFLLKSPDGLEGLFVSLRPKTNEEINIELLKIYIEQVGIMKYADRMKAVKRHVERRLQEKLDQYSLITENMSDGIALMRDGKVEYFSPSYAKLFGYSTQEAHELNFDAIISKIHPDDRQKISDITHRASKEKQQSVTHRFRVRQKSDAYAWVEDRVKINYDDKGNQVAIIINARDITNQVFSEESFKDAEEKFRKIFDNANDALYIHGITDQNIPGRFLEANKLALDRLGYSIEELKKMTPMDIQNPSGQVEVRKRMKTILETGKHRFKSENVTKTGEIIPVEVSSQLFTLKGKKAIVSISRDIRSELEALRIQNEQRALLQSVLDALPGKLRVVGTNYKVLVSNNKQLESSSRAHTSSKNLENPDCFKLFYSRDTPCDNCQFDDILATDKPITKVYYRNENSDKKPKAFKLLLAPVIDHQGKKIGVVEYSVEITELKAAQRKAEELNLAKSDFMMNMSHELRTPLNGILGFSSILANTQLTQEQMEFVKSIEVSGKNLLNIVSDILNFTKMDAKKFELKHEEVDLTTVLNAAHHLVKESAAKKGIQTQLIVDEKIPRFVITDPVSLRQIINNLLINAVKFTDKGTITLEAKLLKRVENSIEILFSVADTGIGIANDMKDKIFESFTQADTTMTREYGGIGLGLTITNSLLKLMDSHIDLTSTPKKGSVFSFKINFKLPESGSITDNSAKTPPLSEAVKKNLNVLIVEDNEINLKLNRLIIKQNFPQVTISCAVNGKEAVEMFIRKRPQIILMDIRMPVLNGFEATEKIRQIEGDNWQTKIIALSADAAVDNIKISLLSGFDAYIVKPASDQEIINQIKKIL